MLSIWIPLLVCIIGALVFAFAKGDVKRLGEHAFWTGLLATLLTLALAHRAIHW